MDGEGAVEDVMTCVNFFAEAADVGLLLPNTCDTDHNYNN